MNKEEKIELIENKIFTNCKDDSKIELEAMQIYLKLLQIKPRTIETLEVGDWIEFDTCWDDNLHHYKGFVTEIENGCFYINEKCFAFNDIYENLFKTKIVNPLDLIKLWSDFHD